VPKGDFEADSLDIEKVAGEFIILDGLFPEELIFVKEVIYYC